MVLLPLCVVGFIVLNARRKTAVSGEADSDSQAFVGGVLNALFTVVLAFYIVFAWQNGDDIDKASEQEANALIDTHWQISTAPEPHANTIRSLTAQYAARVADHEWSALDRGETDPETERLLNSLRAEVLALPADDETLKTAREQSMDNLRQIDEGHRQRVNVATDDQNFNIMLLTASILGGVLMIAFPLIIGLSMRPANIATMVLLTLTISLTIFISIELLHPFHGPFSVAPDAFREALAAFATSAHAGT
ncbi:DUF4239 domain-containing protein [Saccharopolyspora erythraea]|uniref:bestrophin-like domain n=1 Tax=Saccharopolyspora erythraea TaxID=1836 RepID=UPI0020119A16|nr:DUF4239 domain-containing protein [Saccharopolyspora erythraea]